MIFLILAIILALAMVSGDTHAELMTEERERMEEKANG